MEIKLTEIFLDAYAIEKNEKKYFLLKTYNVENRKAYDYFVNKETFELLTEQNAIMGDLLTILLKVTSDRKHFIVKSATVQ